MRDIMRSIAIGICLGVSLINGEAAFGGQRNLTAWLTDAFGAKAETREAELKVLMELRSDQEAAWLAYVLARREYTRIVKYQRQQELTDLASGDLGFKPDYTSAEDDSPVRTSKLALKMQYDELYRVLDDVQKARADKELTPSECGR